MTKSPERQREERMARMLLRLMTYPLPLGFAFLVWILGIDVHPHRVGFACIIAGPVVVIDIAAAWLVYHVHMQAASRR